MTKKRLLLALGIVTLAVATGFLPCLFTLPKTPLRAKYDQVRQGMTAEEVHAIMDDSSFGYTYSSQRDDDVEVFTNVQMVGSFTWVVPPEGQEWACIQFGHGRVTRKNWGNPYEPNDWRRLLKWFGR
jgi:hypothetical protein